MPRTHSSHKPAASETISGEPVGAWIGLDWASQTHVWELLSAEGRVATGEVANDLGSVIEWLETVGKEVPQGSIRILLETKTKPVAHWLAVQRRVEVYVVHPESFKSYRKSRRSSGAKDDRSDAALLNEYLRKEFSNVEQVLAKEDDYAGLAKLVADRRKVVDERSGTVSQLREELALSLPEYRGWFSELTTVAVAKFLARWPSLEALRKAAAGAITRVLREDFHWEQGKIRDWHRQLKGIRPAIGNESLLRASALRVQDLARRLECLAESVAVYNREIEVLASRQEDYALFLGLPGAGKALAPRLMVVFGSDREAWAAASNLQCYTGVAPITKASGRSQVVMARIGCPKFDRQSLVEFARCSVGHCTWAEEYFEQQIAKGVGRQAIFRGLAYKWLRILFRCWKDHRPYDEALYLAARSKRQDGDKGKETPRAKQPSRAPVDIQLKSCGDLWKPALS